MKRTKSFVFSHSESLSYDSTGSLDICAPKVSVLSCSHFDDPSEIKSLIEKVNGGLRAGNDPMRAPDGTSGVYFLFDDMGNKCAIFKPHDEEQNAPNNPHGYISPLFSNCMNRDIPSGSQSLRELASSMVDPRFRIPLVCIVKMKNVSEHMFNMNQGQQHKKLRTGSLHTFVKSTCTRWNPDDIPVNEVHKMGVLDMLILNTDRNENNILVRDGFDGKITWCIDQGLAFPNRMCFYEFDFEWYHWPQTKLPFNAKMKAFIKEFDVEAFIKRINDIDYLKMSITSLFLIRVAALIVKHFAKRDGSLYDIMKFLTRASWKTPSSAEIMINNVQEKFNFSNIFSEEAQVFIVSHLKYQENNLKSHLMIENEFGLLDYLTKQALEKKCEHIASSANDVLHDIHIKKEIHRVVKETQERMLQEIQNNLTMKFGTL